MDLRYFLQGRNLIPKQYGEIPALWNVSFKLELLDNQSHVSLVQFFDESSTA